MIDLTKYRPAFIKGIEREKNEPAICLMCPTPLSKWVKYYCSGYCITQAKAAGLYGQENTGKLV